MTEQTIDINPLVDIRSSLRNIEALLQNLLDIKSLSSYYSVDNGWTRTVIGNVYEYQQQFVFTGAAQNIDISVPFPCQLISIDTFTNDATAKSYTTQLFSGGLDLTSYAQLNSVIADVNQSISLSYVPGERQLTQSPIKIRLAVTASTASKTIDVKIVVMKL